MPLSATSVATESPAHACIQIISNHVRREEQGLTESQGYSEKSYFVKELETAAETRTNLGLMPVLSNTNEFHLFETQIPHL